MKEVIKSDVAHSRLTRICDAMATACRTHPECGDDVDYVLCLKSQSDNRGGIVHSYGDDDAAAIVQLLGHLSALLRAQGKRLEVVPVGLAEGKDLA